MNKTKKTILLLLLAAAPLGMNAQSRKVNVLYLDGSSHVTLMSEIERIEIGDGRVNVVPKSGTAREHPMGSIDRIVLDDKTSMGIDRTKADGELRLTADGAGLRIAGAAEGAAVEMFNAAGQLIAGTRSRNGEATIATRGLAAGTYIVKAPGQTYKIIIK